MTRKSLAQVTQVAKALGYTIERTRSGHWRFDVPNRPPVYLSGTPSDHRAVRNAIADLKRNVRTPA